jgi:hypothetical protein
MILRQVRYTIPATLAVRLKVRSNKAESTTQKTVSGTGKPLVPKRATGLILDSTRLDGKDVSGITLELQAWE